MDVFRDHHFKSQTEWMSDADADELGLLGDKDKKSSVEYKNDNALFSIDNVESDMLRHAVQEIDDATPRRIKILLYKYALFIQLYASLSSSTVEHETAQVIIRKLLDDSYDVDDVLINKISGLLSAF